MGARCGGQFVNHLGGDLVQMHVPVDSWFLSVEAWMKQPSAVPKTYIVEVPEPYVPARVRTPTSKRTLEHTVLIHVSEVMDHGLVISNTPLWDDDGEVDTTRTHQFPFFGGCVDGSGPPQVRDGGHCFGGHNGNGSAGGE